MNEALRAPARNRHGLVIPPDPANITPSRLALQPRRCFIDRHHLYYPRFAFREAGALAFEFREHRFNQVWLPRFQHDKLHRRYNHLIEKQPDYFVPQGDVMATFLDEAYLLDELDVCVKAIDMIDEALYEGRVKHMNSALEHREQRLHIVEEVITQVPHFEVVTQYIARTALQNAARLLEAA